MRYPIVVDAALADAANGEVDVEIRGDIYAKSHIDAAIDEIVDVVPLSHEQDFILDVIVDSHEPEQRIIVEIGNINTAVHLKPGDDHFLAAYHI